MVLLRHRLSSLRTARASGDPRGSRLCRALGRVPATALDGGMELLPGSQSRGLQVRPRSVQFSPTPLPPGVTSFHAFSVAHPVFLPVSSRITFHGAPAHDFVFLPARERGGGGLSDRGSVTDARPASGEVVTGDARTWRRKRSAASRPRCTQTSEGDSGQAGPGTARATLAPAPCLCETPRGTPGNRVW